MATAAKVRKKVLGVKLDQATRDSIAERCDGLGCNFSDYVRDLIARDLDGGGSKADKGKKDSNSSGFIAHNGNPAIELVKALGDDYYLDAKGTKWFMQKDRTLIPVARVHRVTPDNETEVINHDGSVDVYKNGKLDHTRHPPKEPGGRWTYTLYV